MTATLGAAIGRVKRARRGTAVVFAVHGAVTGSFAARLPWIASHVGVDVGQLGIALLMPGIGAMVAMPFSGRLAHRFPLPGFVTATIVVWCSSLVLPPLPGSLVVLCCVLLVFGAAAGLADMAMNAEAALVEKNIGRSVMSSFHGFWSVGVLAGSAVSALAAQAGVDTRLQFAITALVLGSLGTIAAQVLLDEPAAAEAQEPPHFALPSRPILLIGLIGLCAVFGEQAGTDWSAFFIRHELHGSASVAALAVTVVATTMAVTRLAGDRVIRALGPFRSVRLCAACAAAGAAVVVLAPGLVVAFCGLALLGAGVAIVVPIVFAAAGRIGPHPARSIAGVAGIAYGSGLLAPGAIGGTASALSLKASFGLVAVLLVAMGLSAGVLRAHRPVPSGISS